jgi:tRNA A-37 threonylcarbamoyl transferase component Bud32
MSTLDRLEAIFYAALEKTPEDRDAYLAEACGDDVALRDKVARMLVAQEGSFLNVPPEGLAATEARQGTPAASFIPPLPSELASLFPQLEILELIGQGGMGAVYKARQPGLDRLVALKILPPEAGRDSAFAERFSREARALARLNHPHIVAVYDFGQTSGQFFLIMEYVDGVNLRQAMRAGSVSPDKALEIVSQMCEALQFAHDEGVVHRDIKPENILLDRRGRVKIADFGLAKMFRADGESANLTGTHQVMGTLGYMAPEQMEGSRDVDHRADIYSLGVVFYELLTGEVPMGRFQPPSAKVQVDVRIDDVVLKTLEREPERRYQHASEVKCEVESIAGAGGPNSSEAGAVPPDGLSEKTAVEAGAEAPVRGTRWLVERAAGLYFVGLLLISFLWIFHNYLLIEWTFFAMAAAAIGLWQRSRTNDDAQDESLRDSIGLLVLAAAAAWVAKRAVLSAAEMASWIHSNGAAVVGLVFVGLIFFACMRLAPLWRHWVARIPEQRAIRSRRMIPRLAVVAAGVLYVAVGLGLVFNTTFQAMDFLFAHPNAMSGDEFESKYFDRPASLLAQLPTPIESAQKFSLHRADSLNFPATVYVINSFQAGPGDLGPLGVIGFYVFLGIGVLGVGLDATRRQSARSYEAFVGPACAIAGPYLGVMAITLLLTMWTEPISNSFQDSRLVQTFIVRGDAKDVAERVARAAFQFATDADSGVVKQDYVPNINYAFRIDAVDGETVAEYRYALVAPSSLFERWRFFVFGVSRAKPLIVVSQLSGVEAGENVVTIDVRSRLGGFDRHASETIVNHFKQNLADSGEPRLTRPAEPGDGEISELRTQELDEAHVAREKPSQQAPSLTED